jgi:hypothetical protein
MSHTHCNVQVSLDVDDFASNMLCCCFNLWSLYILSVLKVRIHIFDGNNWREGNFHPNTGGKWRLRWTEGPAA